VTIHRLVSLKAVPGWIVTLCFLLLVALLTLALRRNGPDWGYPPWLQQSALVALWIGGYLGVGHLLRRPCTSLRVLAGGDVVLTRIWPGWLRRQRIPRGAIAAVTVREEPDAEGDPHYRTRLVLAGGEAIIVQHGHRAARQEAAAAGLRAALGMAAPDTAGRGGA
jgi:hypothetical protein